MSQIDDICELIAMAYGDRFDALPVDNQERVRVYAASIFEYVKGSKR